MEIEKIIDSLNNYGSYKAFCINDHFYTYRELKNRVISIKNFLKELKNNSPVGIIYSNNLDSYAAALACLFSGRGFVPLNPEIPLEWNKHIINLSEINLCINCVNIEFEFGLIDIIKATELNFDSDKILNDSNLKDLAYILFTSGSTGKPKGVPIYHENLNAFLGSFFELSYKIDYSDRFLQMFELTFDFSLISYLAPLSIGASVYTVSNKSMKNFEIGDILERHSISFATLVPSAISGLKPYFAEMNLKSLKYVLFSGEALCSDISKLFQQCIPNGQIINAYGATEVTIFCTQYLFDKHLDNEYNGIMSIGKPMPHVSLSIIDNSGKEIDKPMVKGELCVSGAQVVSRYLNFPDETSVKFLRNEANYNIYKTGDICFFDDNGLFYYCGRNDSQVKIQGFRVELSEIEYYIKNFSFNTDCAVISAKNKFGSIKLYAFIEKEVSIEALWVYLKERLPRYMLPYKILQLDKIPLNCNGKIDKAHLKKMIKERY